MRAGECQTKNVKDYDEEVRRTYSLVGLLFCTMQNLTRFDVGMGKTINNCYLEHFHAFVLGGKRSRTTFG